MVSFTSLRNFWELSTMIGLIHREDSEAHRVVRKCPSQNSHSSLVNSNPACLLPTLGISPCSTLNSSRPFFCTNVDISGERDQSFHSPKEGKFHTALSSQLKMGMIHCLNSLGLPSWQRKWTQICLGSRLPRWMLPAQNTGFAVILLKVILSSASS